MNLLIGDDILEEFYELNTKLRLSTRQVAAAHVPGVPDFYIPWTCSFPLYGNILDPILLKGAPTCPRGGLVTDPDYLAAVSQFAEHEIKLIKSNSKEGFQDSINGPIGTWLPLTSVSEHIQDIFTKGRAHVLNSSLSICRRYSELVDMVMPINTPDDGNRGFSSHGSRGVLYRGFPSWATEWDVGLDLAHELGHQTLFVWQSVDPLLSSDPSAPVYSLIRHGNRPAQQTYHGAVALAFVLNFARAYEHVPGCQEVAATRGTWYSNTLNESLGLALESLRRDCQFTDIGKVMFDEMDALVQ